MSKRSPSAIRVGLIGRNIAASRSPWLHEREGAAQGLDLSYALFDFAATGRDESDLEAQLAEAEGLGFAGVNVTYPYKQAVIPRLDDLSAGAARVGAVNTVSFDGGRRTGHNTDVVGFGESLRTGLPGARLGRVLQLGAGGGGAATAQALLDLGVEHLRIADRAVEKARALTAKLQQQFGPGRAELEPEVDAAVAQVDGLVNATPMGMASFPGAPIDTTHLSQSQWVADIVYFPLETELLRGARARGCRTLDGSGMAIFQAAAAFEIFTGRLADRARMRRSFLEFRALPPPHLVGD